MTEGGSITNLVSGLGVSPVELASRPGITPDEDREIAEMSRGTSLLLAARERVLSLSEQRVRFFNQPSLGWPTLTQGILTGHPFIRLSSLYCPSWRT